MRFKYGDRVKCLDDRWNILKGATGTVYGYGNNNSAVGVRWDKFAIDKHNLHSVWPECPVCDEGHGWFVPERTLELIHIYAPVGLEEFI